MAESQPQAALTEVSAYLATFSVKLSSSRCLDLVFVF